MSGRVRVQGRGPLPTLPLLVMLLVVVPGPDAAAGDGPVERLVDGFGHSYMIHGYALVEDYQLVPVTTPCQCRQWCQVSTVCHSVSVVEVAEGGVECRVSNRPVDLTDFADRPRLNKTEGAVHFLSYDATKLENVGQSGMIFLNLNSDGWFKCRDRCPAHPECPSRCVYAFITTKLVLEDVLAFVTSGISYNLYLKQLTTDGEFFWADTVPHSSTEIINSTTLIDLSTSTTISRFSMKYENGQVTFKGVSTASQEKCLCMANPLNMEMI